LALLRVDVVRRREDLEPHARAWDRLAAEVPAPSPLRTHAWYAAHVEHKGAEGAWLALCAYEGARLRGVLPLVRAAERTLGFARSRWRVPGEYFTRDGDALLAEGLEGQTLAALLAALAEAEPGALGVDFGGIAPASTTRRALEGADGLRVPLEPEAEGALIPVHGAFDTWYETISENLRTNLRKAKNRLDREQPGALRFRFLAEGEAGAAPLAEFARLEDAGWKGAEGGALARSPAKMALYRTLVERWSALGVLEWHVATLAERPVAMHMAVRLGRTLTLMRICYDETIAKHMPGNLLIRAMVEREHASGRSDAVDFVQTQPWQHHWRMTRYAYARASVPEPGLVPALLHHWPHRAVAAVRGTSWLRTAARALLRHGPR
jgi:CelD/BcsL family acetyltransferase involved in cellulose biosynthesis